MTTESGSAQAAPETSSPAGPARPRGRTGLSRWTAYGTGVGIEVRENELRVAIVRVRPSETGVLGAAAVTEFRSRPAAEWGAELGSFLKKVGAGHIAATVLLPRNDVIVRQIHLPGVANKDLASAIQLQMDSLHPFADDDVYFSYARIGKTSFALVGISRRATIDRYSTLFAEAGIKVASFTFQAAVMYSAARVITTPPESFIAAQNREDGAELYGESPARPVFSAALPLDADRAVAFGRSELRLDPDAQPVRFADLLPEPALFPQHYDPKSGHLEDNALTYATALAGACPWLSTEANLLPRDLRRSSSRVRLIPTLTLATALLLLLVGHAIHSSYSDSRYRALLQHELNRFEGRVRRADTIDKEIVSARARSQTLDDYRRRAKLDMDALADITRLIPPPGWVQGLEMDRATVQISGEVEQAAPLVSAFDRSPLFDKAEFTMPISRGQSGEQFRLRAQRQTPPVTAQQPQPAAAAVKQ
jgi:Tfp pilus assembly protein PilN